MFWTMQEHGEEALHGPNQFESLVTKESYAAKTRNVPELSNYVIEHGNSENN